MRLKISNDGFVINVALVELRGSLSQSLISKICLAGFILVAFIARASFTQSPKMPTYAYHNVLKPRLSGYINRDKLESFLEKRFPRDVHPGPASDRFKIKVGTTCPKNN